ncbi:MAG TPA: multidrug transporter [Candidatus Aphodousia faecipullorum]|nr:multidrug transporter [Candidatus Aphodousia faecipullorum]
MRSTQAILGQDFTVKSHLRFAFPRMMMSLFIMSYVVADGALISYYLGTVALASLNMVFPLAGFLSAIGMMLSAGGGSVVSRRLGDQRAHDADRALSTIVYANIVIGIVLAAIGLIFVDNILLLLNVEQEQMQYAKDYQVVTLLALPVMLLSLASQTFFTVAGYPKMGLIVSIASGLTNVVLDILFMGPFKWGMIGAALATDISWLVSVIAAFIFFVRPKAPIKLLWIKPEWVAITGAIKSGFAEMVGNLSHSITLFLFNTMFLRWLGIDGVAALTIASYSTYVFNCMAYGFCEATNPIIAYNYGAQNWSQLRKIFLNSLKIIAGFSLCAYGASVIFAKPVLAFFTSPGTAVYELLINNFWIYATSLLFMCSNMFGAYIFTAFGDGKRASIVSFARTFGFIVLFIETLPLLIGEIGLWLSVPVAECCTFCLSVWLVWRNRNRYGYSGQPASQINRA